MGEQVDEIRAAHAVDAAWLTAVLHRAGVGVGNEIVAIDDGSIGTGQMGDNVRYCVTWRDPDDALPADRRRQVPVDQRGEPGHA